MRWAGRGVASAMRRDRGVASAGGSRARARGRAGTGGECGVTLPPLKGLVGERVKVVVGR